MLKSYMISWFPVEAFTDDLEDTRSTVNAIEAEYNITTAKLISIEEKLAAIEAKITQAEALLVDVEQPVNFREASDALVIENPQVKSGMEFNEVMLQFKYQSLAEGLLFFVENSGKFFVRTENLLALLLSIGIFHSHR